MHQCPHCDKTFKRKDGLDAHIKRMHPDQGGDPPGDPPGDAQVLEIKPPEESGKGKHHCGDCGQSVVKDAPTCPHCGATLDWPSVGPTSYTCDGCGASLTKGMTNCPGCGESVDWKGVD